MNETLARVVRIQGETAWVRVEAPASCGACGGRGCGSTSVFGQLFNPRPAEYPVDNTIDARVGEAVVVGVEEGAVLRSVFRGYILPLILLLAGAVIGMQMGGEVMAMGGAAFGLVLGFILLRGARSGHPMIVRRGEDYVCHKQDSER